jgi:hypothetical protein
MADLPPLSPYPDSGITPEFVGQLEHSANWARTFGGANTTNIAQRARHNQDLEGYAAALSEQRAAEQEQLLMTNKRAQDLMFGMRRADLQEREAMARMRHAEEIQPLKIQAQEAAIRASLARERAAIQADNLKNKALEQEESDTESFHKALNDGIKSGLKIGTPEWATVVTQARLAAPAMKSEIFDDTWKATSRSPLSPQEAIDNAVEKKKAMMALDAQKQTQSKPDTYAAFNKDLSEMVTAYGGQDKVPADKWAEFESRKAKIGTVAQAADSPATERIATNPKTGEKLALRNGQWVPLK